MPDCSFATIEFTLTPADARRIVYTDRELRELLLEHIEYRDTIHSPRSLIIDQIADGTTLDNSTGWAEYTDTGPAPEPPHDGAPAPAPYRVTIEDGDSPWGLTAFEESRDLLRAWQISYQARDGGHYTWDPYRLTSTDGAPEFEAAISQEGELRLPEHEYRGMLGAAEQAHLDHGEPVETVLAELLARHFDGFNWRQIVAERWAAAPPADQFEPDLGHESCEAGYDGPPATDDDGPNGPQGYSPDEYLSAIA